MKIIQVIIAGKMGQVILENFLKDKDMEKDYGNLQNNSMLRFIKDNIKMIRKMAQEYIDGPMDLIMKELLRMIKNMELVKQSIKMVNWCISNGILVALNET